MSKKHTTCQEENSSVSVTPLPSRIEQTPAGNFRPEGYVNGVMQPMVGAISTTFQPVRRMPQEKEEVVA